MSKRGACTILTGNVRVPQTGWGVEPAFSAIASDALDALRARGATQVHVYAPQRACRPSRLITPGSHQVRATGSLPRPAKKKKRKSACC